MIRTLRRWPGRVALARGTILGLGGAALSVFPAVERITAPQVETGQTVATLADRIQAVSPGVEQIRRSPSGGITPDLVDTGAPGSARSAPARRAGVRLEWGPAPVARARRRFVAFRLRVRGQVVHLAGRALGAGDQQADRLEPQRHFAVGGGALLAAQAGGAEFQGRVVDDAGIRPGGQGVHIGRVEWPGVQAPQHRQAIVGAGVRGQNQVVTVEGAAQVAPDGHCLLYPPDPAAHLTSVAVE